MTKQKHVIELEWDDEQRGPDSVRGMLDGEPVTGKGVPPVLARMAQQISQRLIDDPAPSRPRRMAASKNPRVQYRCSCCGKSTEQVRRLVQGPGGVYVCNECIELLHGMLAEGQSS